MPQTSQPANAIIPRDATIYAAISAINESDLRIALVVDAQQKLVGTVTDGDVRRAILRGLGTDAPVEQAMNADPIVIRGPADRPRALQAMRENICRQVPVLDETGRIVAIETLDGVLDTGGRDNPVFILAGGRGRRLAPLTDTIPKPMLQVGGKPILETIVERLVHSRFHRIIISLNYRGDMIRDHFGDGAAFGAEISYVTEKAPLGTAGPLSLLETPPDAPMIVMNADILTTVDLSALIEFHDSHGAAGTMCVTDHVYQVPFGVVETDGEHRITGLAEKPVQRFLVSAGIYALSPEAVALAPAGRFFDMPDLFAALLEHEMETAAFPIMENWIDIGRPDDFERANYEHEAPGPSKGGEA